MENEVVQAQDSNSAEEVTLEVTEEATTQEESVETVEEVKARLAKAEELANNYKIRAEKAEKKAKETSQVKPAQTATSTRDLVALMEAKVPADDIADVEEFAKFKNISIAEALKSSTVKSILAEKAEKRNTANATNTGAARRSPAKVSDEVLLDKARKGELPESDEDINRLVRQKIGLK